DGVRAREVAAAEGGLRDQAGASRAGERCLVEVRAFERDPVARGCRDDRRLRVGRRGQVRADAPAEVVPGVAVQVRGVLGGGVMVPCRTEDLLVAPRDRAYLAPPVGAVPG